MIDKIATLLAADPALFAEVFVVEQVFIVMFLALCVLVLIRVTGDIEKIKRVLGND